MARVKLLQTRDDVAPEHHALFDELAALRGRVSGPSSVVLYSPGLSRPWNQISEFLHRDSIVEACDAELAVCATAREYDCGYIWAAHVPNALKAGIDEATIATVSNRGAADTLPAREAALVRYVQQLIQTNRVGDAVYAALLQAHDPRWIVELTAWIGRYSALACILNAFEVTPAPEAAQLPDDRDAISARDLQRRALRDAVSRGTNSGTHAEEYMMRGQVVPDELIHVILAEAEAVGLILDPVSARPLGYQPRIPQITSKDQVAASNQTTFDTIAEGRGNVRGPWSLLMHAPALARRVFDVSNYLRFESLVSPRLRELVTVATAREKDCPYVWAAHAPAARKEGVDAATVELIRTRSDLGTLTPADRDVVQYARLLLRTHRVPQALFDRLQAEHGTGGLVELTAVMGHYCFVCAELNAAEVKPAADAEALD